MKITLRHRPVSLALYLIFAGSLAQAQEAQADPYKKGEPKGAPQAKPAPANEKPGPRDPSPEELNPVIQVTVDWLELKTEDVLPILRDTRTAHSEETIQKIRDLESKNPGSLINTISVITKSGQRASQEKVKEYVYPTEFHEVAAPRLKEINLSGAALPNQRVEIAAEAHSTMQPSAFEMRPVGARLEVEPVLSPDQLHIDLNLVPELTEVIGSLPYGQIRLGGANVNAVERPLFAENKVTTAVSLHSGQTVVISTGSGFSKQGAADPAKTVLTLVTAVAIPTF